MQSIATIDFSFPTQSASSRRNELLNELHAIYTEYAQSFPQRNKKRYYAFMKKYHPQAMTPESYNNFKDEFKKAKLPDHQRFLKYVKSSDFLWWGKFSHLKGEEGIEAIAFMISVARDKLNRGECVATYIFGSVKSVDKVA